MALPLIRMNIKKFTDKTTLARNSLKERTSIKRSLFMKKINDGF